MLLRGEALRIEAEATTRGDTIVVHLRDEPIDGGVLPESIIILPFANSGCTWMPAAYPRAGACSRTEDADCEADGIWSHDVVWSMGL